MFNNPENLLVGISGALGMKGSHFLSKHVFWKNAVGYLRNGESSSFQPFAIVYSIPENLLSCQKSTCTDFWSSKNERKLLSKQKYDLWNCCGVSKKWWMLELSNLSHCVQHPWKLAYGDFWSSRNERKPLSKQKCVLGKCCRVLLKW